jgi:hypothetical protein
MDDQDLLILWTLDVMHYEMNFVKNIVKTVTNDKDNIKVRHDLQCKGIRSHVWLIANPRRAAKMLKPLVDYVFLA